MGWFARCINYAAGAVNTLRGGEIKSKSQVEKNGKF